MLIECVRFYRAAKSEMLPKQSMDKGLIRGFLTKATSCGFGSARTTEYDTVANRQALITAQCLAAGLHADFPQLHGHLKSREPLRPAEA